MDLRLFKILKAKSASVGTIRKRKYGRYIKDKPNHWKLLKDHVTHAHKKHDQHANSRYARSMHAAARGLIRHLKSHRSPNDERVMNNWLDEKFGDFHSKAWRTGVKNSVKTYMQDVAALHDKTIDPTKVPSKYYDKVAKWKDDVDAILAKGQSNHDSDGEISAMFANSGMPVAHIMFASREIIGPDVEISGVPTKGFKGLCKSILQRFYEYGPHGIEPEQIQTLNKAFRTFFEKAAGDRTVTKNMPLATALEKLNTKPEWKANKEWFKYCCHRQAMFNEGIVDLASITEYMREAMKFHKGKRPPEINYDDPKDALVRNVELGLVSPRTAMKKLKARDDSESKRNKVLGQVRDEYDKKRKRIKR